MLLHGWGRRWGEDIAALSSASQEAQSFTLLATLGLGKNFHMIKTLECWVEPGSTSSAHYLKGALKVLFLSFRTRGRAGVAASPEG
jgi:hypothetical protein